MAKTKITCFLRPGVVQWLNEERVRRGQDSISATVDEVLNEERLVQLTRRVASQPRSRSQTVDADDRSPKAAAREIAKYAKGKTAVDGFVAVERGDFDSVWWLPQFLEFLKEKHGWEPDDQTLERLREVRDDI